MATISKTAIEAFLRRRLDNWLWIKKVSRDDLLADLKQMKVRPEFKTESWTHQLACFTLALSNPNFLFFLDMGTGKSKLVLDIITQRQREKKLQRALVTVNGQLTIGSWDTAIKTHSDLEPILVTGSSEEKWERLIAPTGDVAVIDYPGLHLALCKKVKQGKKFVYIKDDVKIKYLQKLYNFFLGDEFHEAKNTGTLRFSILRQLTKYMQYRYGATGTPMGRNPEDVFGQFFLVDRGETFGETLGMFRAAFFKEKPHYWKGTEFVFDKSKEKLFYQFMQHRSIRYTEDECNDIPPRKENSLKLDFTSEQREHYLRAVEGLISAGGKLSELDNAYHKLRQIVSGYLHWKDEYGEHTVRLENNPKLDMLQILLEDSGTAKFVVSYEYTESGKMITEMLDGLKIGYEWVHGGVDNSGAVGRFVRNIDKRVFLMQSRIGSTGTDGLQAVAKYLVFFESPASPIIRKQAIKRLHRAGQTNRTFIYDLVLEKSIDQRILNFIQEGKDMHDALVEGHSNRKQILLDF